MADFLLAAAITIGVSVFFPLWKMHLVAPQYSDGLDLFIYSYKIEGGGLNGQHLKEINNLNHYIGMKPIEQADFLEMRWMPFVFGLIIPLISVHMGFGTEGGAEGVGRATTAAVVFMIITVLVIDATFPPLFLN